MKREKRRKFSSSSRRRRKLTVRLNISAKRNDGIDCRRVLSSVFHSREAIATGVRDSDGLDFN